jgi:hypothetical protein
VIDLSVERDVSILGPLTALTATFESDRGEAEAMRVMMDRLQVGDDSPPDSSAGGGQTGARRAFQTYITIYIPTLGANSTQLHWRRGTAVSREIGTAGMSLVTREEIRAPLMVIAFNVKMGVRLCMKAAIDRRDDLPEGLRQYDVSFRGRTGEPQVAQGFGKL